MLELYKWDRFSGRVSAWILMVTYGSATNKKETAAEATFYAIAVDFRGPPALA